MTVWFALEGIDFAVTGEYTKGYMIAADRFKVKHVCARGPSQDIKAALSEHFMKRITTSAAAMARHPIPIPYDMKGGPA